MKIDSCHARDASEQTPSYWTLPATVMGNVAVAMIVTLSVIPPVMRALNVEAAVWFWAAFAAVSIGTFTLASATTQLVRVRRARTQSRPGFLS